MTWSANSTGWKTYDDSDSNITYTDFSGTYSGKKTDTKCYNNTSTQFMNGFCKFKFYGTKLRIIGFTSTVSIGGYSNNVNINIDNLYSETYSCGGTIQYNVILYEKTGLTLGWHSVAISNNYAGTYVNLDAIDIDDIGILKPFDYIFKKYLIEQNSNYYTVKTTNYDSITTHNFSPLTLVGGSIPNKSDVDNFGFEDLNLLTNGMIVGSDTFIPINKFDNTAELKMYRAS